MGVVAGSTRRAATMTVLAAVLAAGAIPCAASARWTRVSRLPSSTEPYFACPGGGERLECQLIEDPTKGSNRHGPLAEGAITRGPELEASPPLYGSGVEGGYAPADLRQAYALPSASAGAG